MPSILELRWEYNPKTLFEERFIAEVNGCSVTVEDGTVVAELPLLAGETQSPLRNNIESYIESLFLGAQVATRIECRLGRPSISILNDDGSRGCIIECEPGVAKGTGGRVELIYTQSDGTVIDTRRKRIERQHRLSRAAAFYGPKDEVLSLMLRSYRSSIEDPEDELIHLYEIRDSLNSAFGDNNIALSKLGITKAAWSRLGQLCNALPLRQGRHRGCVNQPVRSASEDELEEARHLAASFIESYIAYLEQVQSPR